MIDDPRDPPDEDEDLLPEDDEEKEPADAGQDDDEGGDETEARQKSEDASDEGGLAAKPSRATRAVQEAKQAAREASERAARVERELAELRAERSKPQEESPEQERAKLALMTDREAAEYRFDKAERRNAQQMALLRFEMADKTDKASYDAKASFDPRFKKYAGEVETLLATERRAGRDFPRETILKFVLGGKVMEARQDVSRQRKEGQSRIQRQQARTNGGGSDQPAQRSRNNDPDSLEAIRKRLTGVNI